MDHLIPFIIFSIIGIVAILCNIALIGVVTLFIRQRKAQHFLLVVRAVADLLAVCFYVPVRIYWDSAPSDGLPVVLPVIAVISVHICLAISAITHSVMAISRMVFSRSLSVYKKYCTLLLSVVFLVCWSIIVAAIVSVCFALTVVPEKASWLSSIHQSVYLEPQYEYSDYENETQTAIADHHIIQSMNNSDLSSLYKTNFTMESFQNISDLPNDNNDILSYTDEISIKLNVNTFTDVYDDQTKPIKRVVVREKLRKKKSLTENELLGHMQEETYWIYIIIYLLPVFISVVCYGIVLKDLSSTHRDSDDTDRHITGGHMR